jgi:hypothetical protein
MKRISEKFGVVECLHQESNTYPNGNSIDTNDSGQERDDLTLLWLLLGVQKVWYHNEKVHPRQGQQIVTNIEIEATIPQPTRSQCSDCAGNQTRSLKVVPWKGVAASKFRDDSVNSE